MNFSALTRETVLARLAAAVAPDGLLTDEADLLPYARDWSGEHHGLPLAVARPTETWQVAALLACACEHGIPVVPQGGLSGLVGGAVAEPGRSELVISLARMNRIRSLSPIDFSMIVEAGCILEVAKRAAEEHDRLLPIAFGAQGTAHIGGIVSTNAGGLNVLRYGMTRDLVLGLEVVLADGRVWNSLNVLRKDNRGYDLKQLFIGAEGTLGIITAAALKLLPLPTQVEVALVGLRSLPDVMTLHARAREQCSDLLTAFEVVLRSGLEVALAARPDLREPVGEPCPVYVLIEARAGARIDLRGVLEGFLADSEDLLVDGVVAASQAQGEALWLLRELMVEHQGHGGRYLRTDVSVPLSSLARFVEEVQASLGAARPEGKVIIYGHVGDGNLHINIIPPEGMSAAQQDVLFHATEEIIFEVVDRHNGSISAEHGIGRLKREAFLARIDPVSLSLAQGLKDVLDPTGLLSDGRVLASRRRGSNRRMMHDPQDRQD